MKTKAQQNQSPPTVLQVLICTYGQKGLKRVADSSHPKVDGVEYLVSIQQDADTEDLTIPKALDREDFTLIVHLTKGLSVNRNVAISRATAPLLLFSDDDIDYTEDGLHRVISAFNEHPDADILTFRFDTDVPYKTYPDTPVSLADPPKGYFISSIEMAVRRKSVQGKIWFNENFGIGAMFAFGEEEVFLRDALDAGLSGMYIPSMICRHSGITTAGRNLNLPSRPQTKGALWLRLHPSDWPLRMMTHSLREIPLWLKGVAPSPLSYCLNWLKGVRNAKKKSVFPTPDYSPYYPSHE